MGHILRMPNERLVKHAVRMQYEMERNGNIFADTPQNLTFDEIEAIAQNRKWWKSLQAGADIDMKKGPPTAANESMDSVFVPLPEDWVDP